MRSTRSFPVGAHARLLAVGHRFRRDIRGITAVEFAIVSVPFFLIILGIITIGLQHLVSHSLAHGLEASSRKIRTGEAQKEGLTVGGFRQLFCDNAGAMVACDDHLVIHIKTSDTFAGLKPLTACVTDGSLTPSSLSGSEDIAAAAGGKSQRVVVSACYQWDMGLALWQRIWNLLSPTPIVQGRPVLSVATAFRSEPYE